MSDSKFKADQHSLESLLERAQACLSGAEADRSHFSKSDLLELLHEFYIQQSEMEIQNEELRKSQNRLEDERNQYFDYFDAAPVGYFVLDESGAVEEINLAGADLLGLERRRIRGRVFTRYVAGSHRAEYYAHLKAAREKLFRQTCQIGLVKADGTALPVRLDTLPMLKGGKGPPSLRMTVTDLSEQHRMEAGRKTASDEAEQQRAENLYLYDRFRLVAENTSSAIFICNSDRFVFVNSACEALSGYDRSALLQMKPVQVLRPKDRARMDERLKASVGKTETGQSCEMTLVTGDGTEKSIEVIVNRTIENGRPVLLGTALDITEHKQTEAELTQQLDNRSQELVDAIRRFEDEAREKVAAAGAAANPEGEIEISEGKASDLDAALSVLLQKWEAGKQSLEEKMTANLRQVVFPEIQKLKTYTREPEIRRGLDLLEKELRQLTSSFSGILSSNRYGLTPTEIRIAALIKEGLTSDEISVHLNIATKTVSYHRNNIRKKLGLTNMKVNLQIHLLSLS